MQKSKQIVDNLHIFGIFVIFVLGKRGVTTLSIMPKQPKTTMIYCPGCGCKKNARGLKNHWRLSKTCAQITAQSQLNQVQTAIPSYNPQSGLLDSIQETNETSLSFNLPVENHDTDTSESIGDIEMVEIMNNIIINENTHTLAVNQEDQLEEDSISDNENDDDFDIWLDDQSYSENDDYDVVFEQYDNEYMTDDHYRDFVSFPIHFTKALSHEVKLLDILQRIGAPDTAFPSLMDWAKDAAKDDYNFEPKNKKYQEQLEYLTRHIGMSACKPESVTVTLPPDSKPLEVVVFDFALMLGSMFECPQLNRLENLVVNQQDRFAKYDTPNMKLGEFNTGHWYDMAYESCIEDKDNDFLCPIIFACDKTVISEHSNLSVHAIMFTTSIFNRKVSTTCSQCIVSSSHP